MRTLLIVGTAMAAMFGADAASAGQRVIQRGPGMMHGNGGMHAMPHPTMRPTTRPGTPWVGQPNRQRWGSKVGGRWWGGANAPGGWNAYRRPSRGWAVPVYWNSPRFYVSDWSVYGLQQPQYGYNWVRYYDDAVLIDQRGSVYDSVGNVDWDRYDNGYSDDYRGDDRVYASDPQYAPQAPAYAPPPVAYRDDDRRYDNRSYDDRRYGERRENGLGGAAIGAVTGGVAGNLIAGRGNRLGGTLIGAGVGAVAGYAIDKAEDRRRAPPPPPVAPYQGEGYGARYAQPNYAPAPGYAPQRGYAPQPGYAPPRPYPGGGNWVSPDGGTTVVTSGGGYGGSYTTVTVQTAPVVTTTTTEIYEDNVTWSRPAKKKVWKPRRKVVCACR